VTCIVWDDTPSPPLVTAGQPADHVVAAVSELHGVSPVDIRGRDWSAHVARARHAVWRELRRQGWSYPAIGREFDRDHSTVLQALKGRRG
jgi:chromosomal replication initiation ATPase DnaA